MRRLAMLAALLTVACGGSSLDGDHVYTRIACAPGTADCDGRLSTGCETNATTTTNCGACGVACAAGQVCATGTCRAP